MHLSIFLLFAAQTAVPDGPYRCIFDPLAPEERAELSHGAQSGGSLTPAMESRLQAIVRACATDYGWTPDQAGTMTATAIAYVIVEHVGASLAQRGIAPERIERWLARQDARLQTSTEISDADGERLVLDLNAEGVPLPALEANAQMIGAYLGALVMINRVNRNLPVL